MSAAAPPAPAPVAPAPAPAATSGFLDVVRSEWIKARTLRSTYIILGVAVALAVGVGALISWGAGYGHTHNHDTATFDPTGISLGALGLAQLAIMVLGTLAITGEYSTGMIHTSFTAVPRRGRVLAAKAVVYGVVTLVTVEILSFLAFPIGQVILKGQGAPHAAFSDPHVLRAVFGAGLDITLVALLGLAIGTLIRSTAGTIAILVAFLLVLPPILRGALPSSIEHPIIKWWPSEAGSQIYQVTRDSHTLTAWQGLGWFAVFVAVLLVIAGLVLRQRDA